MAASTSQARPPRRLLPFPPKVQGEKCQKESSLLETESAFKSNHTFSPAFLDQEKPSECLRRYDKRCCTAYDLPYHSFHRIQYLLLLLLIQSLPNSSHSYISKVVIGHTSISRKPYIPTNQLSMFLEVQTPFQFFLEPSYTYSTTLNILPSDKQNMQLCLKTKNNHVLLCSEI